MINPLANQQKQYEEALSQLQSGNAQMAAELCELGLGRYPGDANLLCLAARANIALRNFPTAEKRIEEAIRLFPDFAMAHETYGDLLLVRGRAADALKVYEQAMLLDPTRSTVHDKMERARSLDAQSAQAAGTPPSGAKPRRMRFEAEIRAALEHEKAEDFRAAEMIYRDILKKDPDHVEAARLLAAIASRNKRYRDAEVFLKKALSNAPDYARAWVDLANVQRELDKLDEAVESAKQVIRLSPENAESHVLYASAIGMAGDHERAIESYRKALELAPDRANALSGMAHHQKTIGLQQEAIDSYRRAIEVRPEHAEAYWSLANLKTFRFRDDEVAAMEALLEYDELADSAKAQLHNALGLEHEARENYETAFAHFERCNAYRRAEESYDPVETESTNDRIIDMFDRQFFERNAGSADFDVTPILIVGLPRSGSTLIEQILASHSRIEGTHELGDLSRAVQHLRRKTDRRARYPEALASLTVDGWREIGAEYLERTKIHRSGMPFFIDKNPNNFIHVGVLKLALPNAKIIDARRHPMDSCFGSFKQLFASGQPFTYDLTELGLYYLQYRRLMQHWHEVLPGYVLDVEYENVVADLEGQVRRLLDFVGLPFEEACLRFHETERAVKTASSEQVRRPIYSTSVNLWRNYEPHLSELIHILKPVLPAQDGET